MDRFQGIERPEKSRHGGNRTWDIFHVWPDGTQRDGVRFTSTVHVYAAEPPSTAGGKARVRLWVPGGREGQRGDVDFQLGWGEEIWAPVGDWGMASVVSLDDVPLSFYWELTPGKADTQGQRGGTKEVQIRVPTTPPPGV
jgi:hypothetical protein